MSASSRSIFFWLVQAEGGIVPWDPANVDTLAKPCYDFKGLCAAYDYLRDMNEALRNSAGACTSRTTRTPMGNMKSISVMPTH